jgi:hypothetical protein
MRRGMVGLCAAVGTAMSVFAGQVHGYLEPLAVGGAGVVAGLAACYAIPPPKKSPIMSCIETACLSKKTLGRSPLRH